MARKTIGEAVLSLALVGYLGTSIWANQVPEKRTIYIYSAFPYDLHDMGADIMDSLIHYYHNYELSTLREANPPNPSPTTVSLTDLIKQLDSGKWGIIFLESHGDSNAIAVEGFSTLSALNTAYDWYLNHEHIPEAHMTTGLTGHPGDPVRYYALAVTGDFISAHAPHIADKAIVWASACKSFDLDSNFKAGGRVYNYVGSITDAIDDS